MSERTWSAEDVQAVRELAGDASDDEIRDLLVGYAKRRLKNPVGYAVSRGQLGELAADLGQLREARSKTDAQRVIDELRNGPPCPHGEPGGASLHPLTGKPLCPLCRRSQARASGAGIDIPEHSLSASGGDLGDTGASPDPGEDPGKLTLLSDRNELNGAQTTPLTRHSDSSHTSDTYEGDGELLAGVRNGAWLNEQTFPPLRYAIEGLIPEGLTLLVGPPKAGKSWLILSLLLSIASGGLALGRIRIGAARRVLYLALEDGDRRMQDRCRTLLGRETAIPELFSYQTKIVPGQLLPTIAAWLQRYPDTALVVVDTLGKVIPPTMQGESAYQRDYRVSANLKNLADSNAGLAVVVLHHDRKASAEDFVDSVSATHGLAGGADTIVVLARRRQSDEGSLKITGRDVPEGEYALNFAAGQAWQLAAENLHQAAVVARRREDARELSDTMTLVLDYIRQHPEGTSASELKAKFGSNVYQYLTRLIKAGRIDKVSRGRYVPTTLSEVSEV